MIKCYATRLSYRGSGGYVEGDKIKHAVNFEPDLFDMLVSVAEDENISFAEAVRSCCLFALSRYKKGK